MEEKEQYGSEPHDRYGNREERRGRVAGIDAVLPTGRKVRRKMRNFAEKDGIFVRRGNCENFFDELIKLIWAENSPG